MNNLYQSRLASQPHVVRATKYRDFLSARESIDETGRSYAYLCQRQYDNCKTQLHDDRYENDSDFEPFIMSEEIFAEAYEKVKE